MSEEIVSLEAEDGVIYAHAGYPCLLLDDRGVTSVFGRSPHDLPMMPVYNKRLLQAPDHVPVTEERLPLGAVIILERTADCDGAKTERLSEAATLTLLASHSYPPSLRGMVTARRLDTLGTLARSVPAIKIAFSSQSAPPDRLCDVIEEALDAHGVKRAH